MKILNSYLLIIVLFAFHHSPNASIFAHLFLPPSSLPLRSSAL